MSLEQDNSHLVYQTAAQLLQLVLLIHETCRENKHNILKLYNIIYSVNMIVTVHTVHVHVHACTYVHVDVQVYTVYMYMYVIMKKKKDLVCFKYSRKVSQVKA